MRKMRRRESWEFGFDAAPGPTYKRAKRLPFVWCLEGLLPFNVPAGGKIKLEGAQ
jgi:hypothetical protein